MMNIINTTTVRFLAIGLCLSAAVSNPAMAATSKPGYCTARTGSVMTVAGKVTSIRRATYHENSRLLKEVRLGVSAVVSNKLAVDLKNLQYRLYYIDKNLNKKRFGSGRFDIDRYTSAKIRPSRTNLHIADVRQEIGKRAAGSLIPIVAEVYSPECSKNLAYLSHMLAVPKSSGTAPPGRRTVGQSTAPKPRDGRVTPPPRIN